MYESCMNCGRKFSEPGHVFGGLCQNCDKSTHGDEMRDKARIAELEKEATRLRECLKIAGLQAFMRDKLPEEVAHHLRGIADSWLIEERRLKKEIKELREEHYCSCDDNCDDPCPKHARENVLQDRVLKAEAEVRGLREWKEKTMTEISGNGEREADGPGRGGWRANMPLSEQVDRLAKVIMKHYPYEPGSKGKSEGAIEVAARLLSKQATLCPDCKTLQGQVRE